MSRCSQTPAAGCGLTPCSSGSVYRKAAFKALRRTGYAFLPPLGCLYQRRKRPQRAHTPVRKLSGPVRKPSARAEVEHARVEALEAENTRLRAELERLRGSTP